VHFHSPKKPARIGDGVFSSFELYGARIASMVNKNKKKINLTCKVCKLSLFYDAPQEGMKYVHVSCRGCETDFLHCVHIDLRNRTFVRFSCTPASHMRQHFKVAHRHALSNEEIPTQDH
jgi:predicted nucleic-acid-binding Zn-ribbon protein